jgi:hypothetical protein
MAALQITGKAGMIAFVRVDSFGLEPNNEWSGKVFDPIERLTPEEDSIGEPDDQDDEIDDLLPADLWFRGQSSRVSSIPWKAEPSENGHPSQ